MSASQTPTSVGEIFARMGKKIVASAAAHVSDPLMGGFTELPPIDSGMARLLRCEFYADEGALKFRAVGAVVAPAVLPGGIPTAGLETTQFETIPESDPDQGTANVYQVFRKMVGQAKLDSLHAAYGSSPEGINRIAQAITKATAADPIYFRFSNKFEENTKGRMNVATGKPYPGRCWQRWQAAVPGYAPPTVSASMSAPSGTPSAPSTNGRHTDEHRSADGSVKSPAPWSERNGTPPPVGGGGGVDPADTYDLGGDAAAPDVTLLVARAMDGDLQAQNSLEALAGQLGYTPDDCQDASGWDVIAGWVTAGTPKDGGTVSGVVASADFPAVGTTVKYLPQDKKYPKDPTKRNLRPVDCEVVAHGEGAFTIRSLKNPKDQWETHPDDPYLTVAG